MKLREALRAVNAADTRTALPTLTESDAGALPASVRFRLRLSYDLNQSNLSHRIPKKKCVKSFDLC